MKPKKRKTSRVAEIWHQLKKNKVAVASLIVLILIPCFFLFNRKGTPQTQNTPVSAAVSEPPAEPPAASQDTLP